MDADGFRDILLSNNSRDAPKNLCRVMTSVIKKLYTDKVSTWKLVSTCTLDPFLVCRLIPLNTETNGRWRNSSTHYWKSVCASSMFHK